jgi:hypothetical protein
MNRLITMTTAIETAEMKARQMDEASARNLRGVIAVLVEQRGIVIAAGASFAAHLIDLAIMQLRLTINDITEEELSGLADFVSVGLASQDKPN